MFNPRTAYDVTFEPIAIKDFADYKEEYVVRPPYQRKSVWSRKNKQNLLDSLFRRYYIPRIVIRLVRLDEERTVKEVIDRWTATDHDGAGVFCRQTFSA